ncbi:FHA domain-containing protein [bacterium]|nr:MAG: FHA domain-containing protein [bacterium]
MPGSVRLAVLGAPGGPKEIVFEKHDIVVFGRALHCHVSIPHDPFLSKNHFLIEANPPSCVVLDLGSTNGTLVNGAPAVGRVALKDGDVVKAGALEAKVSVRQDDAGPGDPGELQTWRKFPGLEVLRELGSGAMGKVFLVKMAPSGTEAVLKTATLKSGLDDDKRGAYFQREMSATKELRHPNIVAFLDGGRFEGNYYFLLEYCAGGSVSALLERRGGRLGLAEAGPLMLQALDALQFAHARGIVHRDLKPPNLLLTGPEDKPVLKVADFGLAKNFKLAGMSGVTEVGMAAGSLSYAPREQLTNFRFTQPTSDIFSLGATFYTMLSGKGVYDFEGREPLEAVLDGRTVPLAKRAADLPAALCAVIDRAVAVDPEGRWPDAGAFRGALIETLK